MAWLQLTIPAAAHACEAVAAALLEFGALSVTFEDGGGEPVYEPLPGEMPLWRDARVIGLFTATTDPLAVMAALGARLEAETLTAVEWKILEDRDWVRAWMDDFQPMRFGTRLWVCPSHLAPPQPDAVNVLLDPGLAFGTGSHPSTALCLRWLDDTALAGQSVVDYGCGSGILAIAAAKLGAVRVWAVDIDPQALLACRDNAVRNGVEQIVIPVAPEALPSLRADVVLANILAAPLIGLAGRFTALVRAGGYLVLAGILAKQVAAVRNAYQPWFDFDREAEHEGWTLLATRRNTCTP